MLLIEPASQQIQVVLIGKFNPAIIQPGWLAKNGIIGEQEAMNARVDVIHNEISVLHLAHVDFMAEPEKITVLGRSIHFDVVRDFILKTFGEFLYHTPITAIGINRILHFDTGSFERREEFAKRLAPREPWGDWGKEIEGAADGEKHGGLTHIAMKQAARPDDRPGYISVRLEPSSQLQRTGIFMLVNDHYETNPDAGSALAMEVVDLNWDSSLQYSEHIINSVMKNFVESSL